MSDAPRDEPDEISSAAPAASVLVSFYEDTQALDVLLCALEDQSVAGFEVVIADDGSGAEAQAFVRARLGDTGLAARHVWQPDAGFRKTRALNAAVRAARGERLLFLDGDCIPQHTFVQDHLEHGGPGVCLSGRRACLAEGLSERLRRSEHPARFARRHAWRLALDYARLRGRNVEKACRITAPWLRALLRRRARRLTGCNMSLHAADLRALNGFDERYAAPGYGEDRDLDWRLRRAGLEVRDLQYLAPVLHLEHPKRDQGEANRALFEQTVARGEARTPWGLVREGDSAPPT